MKKTIQLQQLFLVPLLLLIFGLKSTNVFAQESANEIIGVWETEAKDGRMEIYKCGDRYCGKMLWGEAIVNEDGSSKKDTKNPDPNLRSRDLVGSTTLTNLIYEKNIFDEGKIYDPSTGKTWNCYIKIKGNSMEFTGYLGFKWLGQTLNWYRIK